MSELTDSSLLHHYLHLYTFHFFRLILTYSSFHNPIYHIHQQVSTSVYFQMNKMFSIYTLFFTFLTLVTARIIIGITNTVTKGVLDKLHDLYSFKQQYEPACELCMEKGAG